MKWSRVLAVCNSGSGSLCHNKVMGEGTEDKGKVTARRGDLSSLSLRRHFPSQEASRPTDGRQQCPRGQHEACREGGEEGGGWDQKSISYSVRMPNCGIPTSMGVGSKAEERKHRVCHFEEYSEASSEALLYSPSSPCWENSERTRAGTVAGRQYESSVCFYGSSPQQWVARLRLLP